MYSPVSSFQTQPAPWVYCHNSSLSAQRKQIFRVCDRLKHIFLFTAVCVQTHPEHLDVNHFIHVLLLVILIPDEDLCRLICLGALEALR